MSPTTRELILRSAQRLMQAGGYAAVSFADIAAEVGIRSASIHHHFATKADLGRALVDAYNTTFAAELTTLDDSGVDAATRLRGYLAILGGALLDDERLCLCTMFAAEYTILPPGVRDAVRDFAAVNESWLTTLLRAGGHDGSLRAVDDPAGEALLIFSEAQGAQLVARCLGDPGRYASIVSRLEQRLGTARPAEPRDAITPRGR